MKKKTVTLLSLGPMILWASLQTAARGQATYGSCYLQDANGQIYDLGALCPQQLDTVGEPRQPILQTGDIQVTLRWDTQDDLDLIVVDPGSDIIDFGSPTSPSGGQLDVDANGFCETQSIAPVENIFWPTGAAPDGNYLAYVALAIPCSLKELAAQDADAASRAYDVLTVPYTLTILNRGVTTTYEGVSQPNQFGREYLFRVGDTDSSDGSAQEITPVNPEQKEEDVFELPSFGLPEL
ncbi:MAG: hypothetical protein AAF821_04270 [Cyanobacteria bacterium P01_D01_bin.156]